MGTVLQLVLAIVAAASLAACADPKTSSENGTLHRIGLTAGPLLQPQPFVIASRPETVQPTPFIYAEPPARSDVPLTAEQQKQLEASLAADAETPPPLTPRKKAPVNQRISPLF